MPGLIEIQYLCSVLDFCGGYAITKTELIDKNLFAETDELTATYVSSMRIGLPDQRDSGLAGAICSGHGICYRYEFAESALIWISSVRA
jgi:hypothetical protein